MTFLEKFYEDHPEDRLEDMGKPWHSQSWGDRCPSDLGYEKESSCSRVGEGESCAECWGRQTGRCYQWVVQYTVRLINGQTEDRELKGIHAQNIAMALASAQLAAKRLVKTDLEVEAVFIYDVGIIDEEYEF